MSKGKILKMLCDNCYTPAIEGSCPRVELGHNARCSTREQFSVLLDKFRDEIVESAPSEFIEQKVKSDMRYNEHVLQVAMWKAEMINESKIK